jgi:hypothetical protein
MFAYNGTNYPKIYKDIYWGHFIIHKNNMITVEILENRNKLIEEYDIKCICNTPKFIEKEIEKMTKDIGDYILDHIECYKTNDKKYLLISSPYNDTNTSKYQDSGWSEIYKIYSIDASSYIKIFSVR